MRKNFRDGEPLLNNNVPGSCRPPSPRAPRAVPLSLAGDAPSPPTPLPRAGEGSTNRKHPTAGRKARLEVLESRLALSAMTAMPFPLDAPEAVAGLASPTAAVARPVTQAVSVDSSTPTLVVHATGTDAGGPGLAFFNFYVQVDNKSPKLFGHVSAGTASGAGQYQATADYLAIVDGFVHSYRFYTRGVDEAGRTEAAPGKNQDVVLHSAFENPAVKITQVPKFGKAGNLQGKVTGVNPANYRVAAYIYVEGSGWWDKPTDANSTVPINASGTFSVHVVTGGLDAEATIYYAMLVPVGDTPPLAHGDASMPVDPLAKAVATKERYTSGPTVQFAGQTWAIKDAPSGAGPGGNLFSVQPKDVWVDSQGLHLSIDQHNGQWWSSEVILPKSLGYGTYAFVTDSRLDTLDPNAVFGGFTWDPLGGDTTFPTWPNREADIEVSRFGNASDTQDAQFVLQPYQLAGHLDRFTLPNLSAGANVTWFMQWAPGGIQYTAVQGNYPSGNYPPSAVIQQWTYAGAVPQPGQAMFHFNLWLDASAPAGGKPVSVLIRDFHFTALAEAGQNVGAATTGSGAANVTAAIAGFQAGPKAPSGYPVPFSSDENWDSPLPLAIADGGAAGNVKPQAASAADSDPGYTVRREAFQGDDP